MRILTVGNMYPPHHFGGYEIVWGAAVDYLRSLGHDVSVLTTDTWTSDRRDDPPWVHRDLRWALRGSEFRPLGRRGRVRQVRHNHAVLNTELERTRPDVVAWFAMGGLSLTMLETVRRRGIPAVAFVHDEWLDYGRWVDEWLHTFRGRRRVMAPLLEPCLGIPARVDFARAATYVFVSDHTRRKSGLPAHAATGVAHSGIHESFLDPAPERPWDWRLLYVGRLDPRKGVDTALEAVAQLPTEATLRLTGGWDATEEDRLRRVADGLGLGERVRFDGHVGREGVHRAYAESDAVIFPVRWDEPWGLVPLEAMGRGRPVLATGRGGSGEYLEAGVNHLHFEADDPAALAEGVRRLAEDPDLRRRLRAGGLRTAPRHTEAVFNRAVLNWISRAAATRSR